MNLSSLLPTLALLLATARLASSTPTSATTYQAPPAKTPFTLRIDPTFWWVGMKNPKLQLLVHGPGIGTGQAMLAAYPGVTLESVQKVKNPNYLVVNLNIGPEAQPGQLRLAFNGRQKWAYTYELRARNTDPDRTQGLTQADFIYMLMPDRFSNGDPKNDVVKGTRVNHVARDSMYARHGGDLKGIQNHFAYFKQLGATAIWPTPLVENDMPKASYHGYAVTDCYKIDPRYGTNQEYVEFVRAAHSQGLKVVQDIVLNHWGSYHHLFLDQPAADWFHAFPTFTRSNYNAYTLNDPHGSTLDRKLYNDGWFDTTMPDVNQSNPLVATYLIQNFLWWVELTGLDGYRIDTYPYSNPQFLMAWGQAIAREYPKLTLFGEAFEATEAQQAFFAQNILPPVNGFKSNLPGVLDFQIAFAIGDALKDDSGDLNKLYRALQADWLYLDATRNVPFLDNHDLNRFYSVIGENFDKYKIGLAWLLTLRGTPQLYYGTEVLMKNFANPDGKVREDFPGGWAGDPTNYFVARPGPAGAAFDYVSKLANYRKTHPVLSGGKLMQFIPQDGVYTYFRYQEGGECVMIIANNTKAEKQVDGTRFAERTKGFSSGVEVVSGAAIADLKMLRVPACTAWVVELRR
ncbi:cyclomaltodextrinase N-terminal domain-containing protein [Hymenobacter sp. BT664]|uniref:Cyclomaltodextrinase N-terminal domain-containing protein n=1 Tax=Hymenobacter montanus TaxID=2771359 RepID=A0A927GK88_9BACT|nr:alpha-amylase family glycosyl hydrolase [Hymenobacter montanus]MBD2769313.1 cyclomaltodextrinase N-terminal domain-containing protein [Hymenobacter montanus]